MIYINQARFQPFLYGDETIQRYSEIIIQNFDERVPCWIDAKLLLTQLQDQTAIVNFGQDGTTELIKLNMYDRLAKPSAWNDHPSRNATGLYKFGSFEVSVDQRIQTANRSSYDILDWLRDIGGLTKAILAFGSVTISIFTTYNLNTFLLTTLFRMTHRQAPGDGGDDDQSPDKSSNARAGQKFKSEALHKSATMRHFVQAKPQK